MIVFLNLLSLTYYLIRIKEYEKAIEELKET